MVKINLKLSIIGQINENKCKCESVDMTEKNHLFGFFNKQ